MKKSHWVFLTALLIAVTGYLGYYAYANAQREHHIFCESLLRGMTPEQVLTSLKSFGEIEYNKAEINPSGYDQIAIRYTSSQIVSQKAYLLSFEDGAYIDVSAMVGFETVDYFCE